MGAREYFDVAELKNSAFGAYLRPPPLLSCAEWADQYREIVKGPEKGRWRTARTPFLREPMECTDPEHPAQRVALMFATQMGKSEMIYNAVFKRIHVDPMDMLFVQPTLNDAKDHSRQRFTPTVKTMPEVLEKLAKPRSREEQNTWQTKEIRGGATLFFAGANSARSLASKPLPFASCDEIDGYPLDVDGEGDPLGLVWERMSNFPQRKLLLSSTPTIAGFSRIEAEYKSSDQRRYYVPCPHCGTPQVLIWGADTEHGIKWLKTPTGAPRLDSAVYICAHCAAAIVETKHKTGMLENGRWIAENPDAWASGRAAGFHLSKIYSPVGWKSWAMLVDDWVKATAATHVGDNTKLKTFINTSLAETFEEQGDRANVQELKRRAVDFEMRIVHVGCVMTMGVDVQKDRVEARIWSWSRGLESQLVDRATFYGDPMLPESSDASPWAKLTEYRRSPVLHTSGVPVPLLGVAIDSGDGHTTQAVYVYCREHAAESVLAVKGASIAGKVIIGKPKQQDVDWRGQTLKKGVKLWPIGTDTAKADLYGRLRVTSPGAGYVHLSKKLPDQAFEEITSERLVTRYVRGHPRQAWVLPPGRRNEELDCAVYARAIAQWAGVDRWKDADWETRELPFRKKANGAPAAPPRSAGPGGGISLSGFKRFVK